MVRQDNRQPPKERSGFSSCVLFVHVFRNVVVQGYPIVYILIGTHSGQSFIKTLYPSSFRFSSPTTYLRL